MFSIQKINRIYLKNDIVPLQMPINFAAKISPARTHESAKTEIPLSPRQKIIHNQSATEPSEPPRRVTPANIATTKKKKAAPRNESSQPAVKPRRRFHSSTRPRRTGVIRCIAPIHPPPPAALHRENSRNSGARCARAHNSNFRAKVSDIARRPAGWRV